MTKATTLTLAETLSISMTDTTLDDRLYDDLIYELGTLTILIDTALLSSTLEQTSFTLSSTAIELLDVHYQNTSLDPIDLADLESINPSWRDETGPPIAYVLENEAERTFRIYPKPPFPITNSVRLIFTEYVADIPVWLELPIALSLLHREFMRESDHRDEPYAVQSQNIAQLLFSMILTQ